MSGLDETQPSSDQASASPDQLSGVVTLDGNKLQQLRSALMNAGITASMIDLPHDHDDSTKSSASLADTDVENGLDDEPQDANNENENRDKRKSSVSQIGTWWLSRKLNRRAKLRKLETLDDTEEYEVSQGIYSMFWISENWSLPFWYALVSAGIKFTLYANVLYYIYRSDGYRVNQREKEGMPPPIVMATQFLLIPTSIGITEELMWTLDVIGKVGWSRVEDRPHATRVKWHVSMALRAVDGLTWLLIITSLMLYSTEVLSMFLNFAALQFLQDVDNVAFEMAKSGYLSARLERTANDVCTTKLPSQRGTWREYLDTIVLGVIFCLMVIAWAAVNFLDTVEKIAV